MSHILIFRRRNSNFRRTASGRGLVDSTGTATAGSGATAAAEAPVAGASSSSPFGALARFGRSATFSGPASGAATGDQAAPKRMFTYVPKERELVTKPTDDNEIRVIEFVHGVKKEAPHQQQQRRHSEDSDDHDHLHQQQKQHVKQQQDGDVRLDVLNGKVGQWLPDSSQLVYPACGRASVIDKIGLCLN